MEDDDDFVEDEDVTLFISSSCSCVSVLVECRPLFDLFSSLSKGFEIQMQRSKIGRLALLFKEDF